MALVLVLLLSVFLSANAAADLSLEERLSEHGLSILALRNDTIDSNQDGETDAVRVVLVLNSTAAQQDIIVKLRGLHKEKEVLEIQEISFQGQTNISLRYDAWSKGDHALRLDVFDEDGEFIASIPLPSFALTPALATPFLSLELSTENALKTGEDCEIERIFDDETGPRYGQSGVRTLSGTPFQVLDTQAVLDCSGWPAGRYSLRETYRNGLGQTAESTLNFTINNRPAPEFEILISGHENSTDTPCQLTMKPSAASEKNSWLKIWRVKGVLIGGANSSVLDCSNLPAGAYLVTLEAVNEKQITSTRGVNLIRLPAQEVALLDNGTAPSTSLGKDTPTDAVGWISIGALGIIVTFSVFLMLARSPQESEEILLVEERPRQVLADGSPDTKGLPTVRDDHGVLWRQYPDGRMDWWDDEWQVWHGWET